MRILVAAVSLLLIAPLAAVRAQEHPLPGATPARETSPAGGGLCFRGRPLPGCSSYPLIEFGAYRKLDALRQGQLGYMMTADLGWMRNITARDALGVSAFGAAYGRRSDADGAAAGVMLHYRRWLSARSSLGLSLGSPVAGDMELGKPRFPSLITELKWNYGDWFALSTRLEHTRYRDWHFGCADNVGWWLQTACWRVEAPDHDTALYVGAEFGAYTGIVGILTGTAIVILDFLANISS